MAETKWFWDLDRQRAVTAEERGPSDNTLGPYDSRYEAENWRKKVEERNDAWDDADEDWAGDDPNNGPDSGPAGD